MRRILRACPCWRKLMRYSLFAPSVSRLPLSEVAARDFGLRDDRVVLQVVGTAVGVVGVVVGNAVISELDPALPLA